MLKAVVLGLVVAAASFVTVPTAAGCSVEAIIRGHCSSTSSDGTSVTVGGTQTINGSNNSSNGSNNGSGPSRSGSGGPGGDEGPVRGSGPDAVGGVRLCADLQWSTIIELDCVIPMSDEPDAPTITITDVARFLPQPVSLTVEPEGVGIAGLPTNFVAPSRVHTAHGTLFGYAVSVRFTPVAHTFHFGDGQSRRTTTGGSTWAALGLAQFTPTETSHTYGDRGAYTSRIDTHYTAEVNLGHGWVRMSGELTATGTGQALQVYEARTALVAHTCDTTPHAAGC